MFQIRNTVDVVTAIIADLCGDHFAKWIPPPPILFKGILTSEAVKKNLIVLIEFVLIKTVLIEDYLYSKYTLKYQ